ncbi:TadE/TadG family type IV pilus assembly protein [Kitasatospora sp. NPDC085895]|uniref:TadE/TadG family type IV pilus assembly protein n=1 Tax=Kitasatospora sp. NPDC085895 TaxID=3155057 RepID=UPI00344CECA8
MTVRVLLARARRRACRRGRDTGDANLQMLICFPAALLLLLMVVQAGCIYLAKQAAQTAAREGIAAARGYGAGPDAGVDRARQVADRFSGTLNSPQISTSGSSATQARITVRAKAPALLGWQPTVTESASGPVERWTTP